MKVYEVDKKEFYKGYTLKYLLFFKRRLNLIEKQLDEGNLEQALVLTMDEPYVEYPEFNFYRINILIRLGHIDLALDIAKDKRFVDFEPIQIQRKGLEEEIRIRNAEEERKRKEEITKLNKSYSNENVSTEVSVRKKNYITKLYVGILSLEDIENAKLPYFDKVLLTICYYDKYNHAAGLKYIKSIKDTITDEHERKIVNNLRNRLEMKRNNFFDIAFYKKYISSVDFNYATILQSKIQNKLETEIKKEEDRKALEETKSETSIVVPEEKTIHEEEIAVIEPDIIQEDREVIQEVKEIPTSPIISRQDPGLIKVTKVKKKKKDKEARRNEVRQDNSIVRIKDAFASEVEIMGSSIYVEANRLGTAASVKAFDIFENIVEQDVNNINALEKFERLVIKFSRDKSIGITYNEERFNKYLKKEKK